MKKMIKKFLLKHVWIINYFPFNNNLKIGKQNYTNFGESILIKCKIKIHGNGNKIILKKDVI